VFRNIDFNSEANLGQTKDRNRRLKNLLEDFAKPALDLRPSRVSEDVIGNTYIYLIERFAPTPARRRASSTRPSRSPAAGQAGRTPSPATASATPACGSGGLLIEAGELVGPGQPTSPSTARR
jgi:type I restriction enzyme M protein